MTDVQDQLRIYTVKSGEMGEWVAEWRQKIVPLREKAGFKILGAWSIEKENRFVWIIRYDGSKTWEEADSAYYGSPERAAIQPNPTRHLDKTETWMLNSIQP
jgi:hypothetical protein